MADGRDNTRNNNPGSSPKQCDNCGVVMLPSDSQCQNCGQDISTRRKQSDYSHKESSFRSKFVYTNNRHPEDKKIAIYGVCLIIFGTVLPWISVTALGTKVTAHGIETLGLFASLSGILMIIAIFLGEWNYRTRGLIGTATILTLIVVVLGLADPMALVLEDSGSSPRQAATQVGPGIYVTGLGCLLTLYAAKES